MSPSNSTGRNGTPSAAAGGTGCTGASGFTRADLEYRSPVPPHDRLQRVAPADEASQVLADLIETFNANVEKLNARMFTHLDYAVIGTR